MSRRARERPDKREDSLRLARFMGHGTPMPERDDTPVDAEEWDGHGEDPLGRTPIGPMNVMPKFPHRPAKAG